MGRASIKTFGTHLTYFRSVITMPIKECKAMSLVKGDRFTMLLFFQLETTTIYEERRIIRARLRQVMAEQEGKGTFQFLTYL